MEDNVVTEPQTTSFSARAGFSERRSSLRPSLATQYPQLSQQENRRISNRFSSQTTPPLTPQIQPPHVSLCEAESDSFHNYLRAFHPFHPTATVTSVAEESSITIPINRGDIILVHSIQPNGWADGTLLTSGARGWLPTNYCEAYDNDAMRSLLNAVTHCWEFIRNHEDGDLTIYTKQDYARGMIAGVRLFLDRCNCLTRDAALVQSHVSIRRMRKGLLADLSMFVKAAKNLQEACQQHIPLESRYEVLDDIVLKAFKVVTRAVRFHDIWTQDVYLKDFGGAHGAPERLPLTPPADAISQGQTQSEARSAGCGDEVAAPGDADAVQPSHAQATDAQPEPNAASTPNFSRSDVRPLSVAMKRASVSHRWSYNFKSPMSRKFTLASEQLASSHDAFLGFLGAFIGLHLQSRSSMELLVTTQQSVAACQSLLAVVEEVWDRDYRRSASIDEAKDVMHAKLAELVQATRDTFKSPPNGDGNEVEMFMPDQGRRLMDAATVCVRAAGDCVAKTKCVIERIGDFDFEPISLGVADEPEQKPTSETTGSAAQTAETVERADSTEDSFAPPPPPSNSPPPPPKVSDLPLRRDDTTPRDSSYLPTPAMTHSSSTSRSSFETVVPAAKVPPPLSLSQKKSPNLELEIPPISPFDFPRPPASSSPYRADFKRADSAGISITDSTSTVFSSIRYSNNSFASHNSTQATSPDQSPVRDNGENALQGSFSSLTESQSSIAEECEDAETLTLAKTFAHELSFNKDGQITGGTLPALVERLTIHDATPDAMFVNTFYLTFRLFTTPIELAQRLVERFDHVGEKQKLAQPIRLRVYNVFKGWLETHWHADTDAKALPTILDFANGKLKASLPSASKRLVELTDKVSVLQEGALVPRLVSSMGKTNTVLGTTAALDAPMPSPNVSKSQLTLLRNAKEGKSSCSILDFDALELARQFTLIESKIFCSIQPEELLALEWTKKVGSKAVNVRAMSTLSTDLANLVADTILQFEEPKKRAVVIKQWVKIAKRCLELHNYDSLMAIICSLNSSMVLRLKRTWDLVPPKTVAKLDSLKSIVDVSRNYAVLRQRLQGHVPPCLPFVGIYLTDLTFVDVGNQTTRKLSCIDSEDESVTVINFDKHMKTAKVIGELQRFQLPYRLTPVPEMQDWMESQIRRVRSSDESNVQNYYRRSLLLEPREIASNKAQPIESASTSFGSTTGIKESTKEKFEFWHSLYFPSSKEKATN